MSDFIYLNQCSGALEVEPLLRDAFSGWEEGAGIFSYLGTAETLPWSEDSHIDNSVLDLLYFGNHSGAKFCAPIVKVLLDEGEVPAASRAILAKMIMSKYYYNWKSLWETNVAVYNPLYNYDLHDERVLSASKDETSVIDGSLRRTGTDTLAHGKVETTDSTESEAETTEYGKTETTTHGKQTTDTTQHGETETITHGKSVTDATVHGKTETTTHGKQTTDNTFKFGFNSGDTTPAPSDRDIVAESGTTAVANSGTDSETVTESGTTATSHGGTDTRTLRDSGTTAIADSGSDSTDISRDVEKTVTNSGSDIQTKNLLDENDVTETLEHTSEETEASHRYGNIGVTTTQKLLKEERELWIWNYFEQVFNDLDRELSLAFHSPTRI